MRVRVDQGVDEVKLFSIAETGHTISLSEAGMFL